MAAAPNPLLTVAVMKRQKATTGSSLNLASTSSSPKVKRRNSSLGLQNLLMPWYKGSRKEKTSSKYFEEDEADTPVFPAALNFLEDKPVVNNVPSKPSSQSIKRVPSEPVVPGSSPRTKETTGLEKFSVHFAKHWVLCLADCEGWLADWDDGHVTDFYDDCTAKSPSRHEDLTYWVFQRGATLFRRQGFRRKSPRSINRPLSSVEVLKYQQEFERRALGGDEQVQGNFPDQVPLTRCSSLPPEMRLSTTKAADKVNYCQGADGTNRALITAGSASSDNVFFPDLHFENAPTQEDDEEGATSPSSSPQRFVIAQEGDQKNCTVCKCPRQVHDVSHQEAVNVRDRLGLVSKPGGVAAHTGMPLPARSTPPPPVISPFIGQQSKEMTALLDVYTWTPPGLSPERTEEFMRLLPRDKVPKRSTPGERWRERQLAYQLPRQDLALAYCHYVEPQCQSSYADFVAARNDIALDIGYAREAPHRSMTCYGCGSPIPAGALVVMAPKFGETAAWHPACFSCNACSELLVDLTHCIHDDQIYCERHYAEQLKPRCAACDELIFSGEYTKAMSKDWHLGHFSCWQCDESLTGQRYVLRDDHPYCVKCYETVFANTCDECNKLIGIDSKDLSYKERHWHEACFLCNKCRVSLVDKQFGSKADKIYCGPCYDSQFATRCDGCGEIFRAGTKKMEYKSRQWHEKCFCCCVCKTAIGTKSFIPRDQDIYCAGCYEEKFATRCVKCSKIITTGGVTYKNEPWHRECFTCTHCNTSLAGQRFTSRDEKPYCADCFGELFAKRCTACTKPITGIGGTRFISFEDRHWHNDCFVCASCTTSLVGKGFITDGADILCPECAKQRVL